MKAKSRTQTPTTGQLIGIILTSCVMLFCTCGQAQGSKNETQSLGSEKMACDMSDFAALLKQHFCLAQERNPERRYYEMVTQVVYYEPDGKQKPYVNLRLLLKCEPAGKSSQDGYRYTCVKISYQQMGKPEVEIPALAGWAYLFKQTEQGDYNQSGLVLGIEHSKFQGLSDAQGNPMPPEMSYALYNTFIDFHAFCNNFSERSNSGKGIQHLNKIGQGIVHSSAFSEPTTHLSGNVAKGSYFKNGKVTLHFKGISVVDTEPCAIVSFDSGKSSFKMAFNPSPDMEINTVGASHYWGDLFIELDSKWVRKCTMGELVVSQTQIGKQQAINAVMERESLIRSLDKKGFETMKTAKQH